MSLAEELISTNCAQLFKEHNHLPVVTVAEGKSLLGTLAILNEKHISSAVALGPQNRYSGLVDLMDITRYFVSVCATDEEELPANRPDTATDRFQEKLEVLKHATIAGIIKTPDAEASPGFQGKRRKSASSWYYPISTEMSLYNAIETLGVTGQHRLPIINSVGRVTGVVTESMIIRWIYYNKDICDQSVMETQIMHLRKFRNLVTIHENQSALAAFTLMEANRVEGLPVVDDDGFIVDVISCRDIQIMNRSLSRLECLWDKISSYKSTVRNVMGSDKDTGSSGSAVRQREREDNLQRQIDATRASIQRGRSYQHTTPSSSISRTYIPPSSRFPANDSSTSPPVRPITCYLTDRFVDVLDLMIRHDTRRIFVLHSEVDPRPVDVISHSDVLRIITEKLLRKR